MVNGVALAGASATETLDNQLKKQHKQGLCTTLRFDTAAQKWLYCTNKQHRRGRKKKCLDCLKSSGDLNERLIAQGFCCKLDHPVGRGCPDRFLREGRFHLIDQEQVDWYWNKILTAEGPVEAENPSDLPPSQLEYLICCAISLSALLSHPPTMSRFKRMVRCRIASKRRMTRIERDWFIVLGATYADMWRDPELNLKRQARLKLSQAIKNSMEAARLAGRHIGRPRTKG